MFVPILFIASNALQPKPQEAKMQVILLFYSGKTLLFVLFQLSWLLWLIPLRKTISNDTMLLSTSIVLFILPLFHFGAWNDLCMRASMPALCILDFSITQKCFCFLKERKRARFLFVEALLFTASLAYFVEIKDSLDVYNRKKAEGYSGRIYSEREHFTDEFISSTVMKYQYISWEPNRLLDILIKKHTRE